MIDDTADLPAYTKAAAFYRYSTTNLRPDYFDSNFRIVSNIIEAENGSSYSLDISAPDFSTFESSYAFIDIILWQDDNEVIKHSTWETY